MNKDQSQKPVADDTSKSIWKQRILDEGLLQLVDEAQQKECSVIIEADLPKRLFTVDKSEGNPAKLRSLESAENNDDRNAILEELAKQIRKIAGDKNVNLLKTSGAVVVKVPAPKLVAIAQLVNVKAIRPNRKLSKKRIQAPS